jgi:Na+/glutamate symporter
MDEAVTKFTEYVDSLWNGRWQGLIKAQQQLLGWLFAVHGAGIAASLGFVTSKGISLGVQIALGAFVFGLVALLVYGTLFYYYEVHHFNVYKQEVEKLHLGKLSPQEFLGKQAAKRNWYRSCEVIAWLSGICVLIGLVALIAAVLTLSGTKQSQRVKTISSAICGAVLGVRAQLASVAAHITL